MIVKAIRDAIVADSTLTALLATYDFGSGAAPAVFTMDPLPSDVAYPAMTVTVAGGDAWGTRAKKGWEQLIDVRCFDDRTRSGAALRDIAWRAAETLHRASLSVAGYEEVGVHVTRTPLPLEDPDGYPGIVLTLLVRVLEE